MIFVKMLLREKKVKFFSVTNWESHTKTRSTAEVTLHALLSLPTDGGEWLASQTRHFNPRRNYFKDSSLFGFDNMSLVSHSWH